MTPLDSIPISAEFETGNVQPLLHEIRHALTRLADDGGGTIIDLKRLPLAAGELDRILDTRGTGEVRAELDALGPTTVQETAYAGVWLVTHRNTEQVETARLIEVSRMPELLMSQRSDVEDAVARLDHVLQIREADHA